MIALTYKAKNYATLALKVGILSISFYYLFTKFTDQQVYLNSWWAQLRHPLHLLAIAGFLMMSGLNWLLEARKWQLLVQNYRTISFGEALKQTLASLTVSVATPNRIGEYGAKAYFFPRKDLKRILFLNGLGNISQMIITAAFGIIGLFWWGNELPILIQSPQLVGFFVLGTVILIALYLISRKTQMLQSLKLHAIKNHLQKISVATKIQVLGLSLGRYILFSTQFYLVLLMMGAEVSLWTALPIIYIMYLLVSLLPMLPFLDVVVKGSVAVWLFQIVPVDELAVLATILGVWVFNLVIPSIFGSFQLIKAPN